MFDYLSEISALAFIMGGLGKEMGTGIGSLLIAQF